MSKPVFAVHADVMLPNGGTASGSTDNAGTNKTSTSDDQPIVELSTFHAASTEGPSLLFSRGRTVFVIATLTGITFASSMSTGILTIGLPRIAADIQLADNLLLWPASVYSLASGCCLLLAGSIADFLGNRNINLIGTFILGVFILASGLARTGIELIVFRAFQGIGVSMCFPTGVSILTDSFPNGRRRNVGFACLGLGQPFGFSVGLVLGGFFEDSVVGWRFGFYLCAVATIVLFGVNCWYLPLDRPRLPFSWTRFANEIDWVGAALASSSLGILSYVFAMITGSTSSMRHPQNITLLCIAVLEIPAFIFWMHRQESLSRPALIPNSIWKNAAFTAICIMVLLSWAVIQSMEWFLSLFFQKIQHLSALQASIRFLPNVIIGIILNVSTGLLVHRIRADHLILCTSVLSAGSPVLMAIIDPNWNWWYCAFWAVLLGPVSVDVIFTIANLIVTDVFPPHTQALAGAVFNTAAQFGTSIGIAIMAIISSSTTADSRYTPKTSPDALMVGYRAVFWACFAFVLLASGAALGLRKVGRVGLKKD